MLDAKEAEEATAAAAKDSEGVLAKEAAAVKAEAEQAGGTTEAAGVKGEQAGPDAATSERAISEQDASTSGRETVPGGLSPGQRYPSRRSITSRQIVLLARSQTSCCNIRNK